MTNRNLEEQAAIIIAAFQYRITLSAAGCASRLIVGSSACRCLWYTNESICGGIRSVDDVSRRPKYFGQSEISWKKKWPMRKLRAECDLLSSAEFACYREKVMTVVLGRKLQ